VSDVLVVGRSAVSGETEPVLYAGNDTKPNAKKPSKKRFELETSLLSFPFHETMQTETTDGENHLALVVEYRPLQASSLAFSSLLLFSLCPSPFSLRPLPFPRSFELRLLLAGGTGEAS
jgi:hypothetical protein